MYKGRRIAVVIPAFNIAQHIDGVVKGIPEFVDDIIVVEDAGTDETAEVIRELGEPRLRMVQQAVNQGVGGAMVTGFRLAMDGGADVVAKMDGDGQMDPGYLPALLDLIVSQG